MDPASTSIWIPAFVQGGMGVVVAYVIYVCLNRTLPENAKNLRESQENFLKALSEQSNSYRLDLEALRNHNDGNVGRLFDAIERQNRILERQSRLLLLIYQQGRGAKQLSEDEAMALGLQEKRSE